MFLQELQERIMFVILTAIRRLLFAVAMHQRYLLILLRLGLMLKLGVERDPIAKW